MACEDVITNLAKTVREEFPVDRYQEVVEQFNLGDEQNRDRAAGRVLAWLEKDDERRRQLGHLASGSTCKLSAAREILAVSRSLVTAVAA